MLLIATTITLSMKTAALILGIVAVACLVIGYVCGLPDENQGSED